MEFKITSSAFQDGGWIPVEHTARGADRSPELRFEGLCDGAKALAITMDDASHPLFPNYNHWVIWNLPVMARLPAGVPRGAEVPALGGAIQGRAYGRHRYKGPKPPLRAVHTYVFTVYALDGPLALGPGSTRRDLLTAMEGHVLQSAALTGRFQSPPRRLPR
jgi:Raf kinase inhibitor-like YbhB/YbcL family protein